MSGKFIEEFIFNLQIIFGSDFARQEYTEMSQGTENNMYIFSNIYF